MADKKTLIIIGIIFLFVVMYGQKPVKEAFVEQTICDEHQTAFGYIAADNFGIINGAINSCKAEGCKVRKVLDIPSFIPLFFLQFDVYQCMRCGEVGQRVEAPSSCCTKSAFYEDDFGDSFDYVCREAPSPSDQISDFFTDLKISPAVIFIGGAVLLLVLFMF